LTTLASGTRQAAVIDLFEEKGDPTMTNATTLAGPLAIALAALALSAGCGPTYPNCGEDTDCHSGEYCVNGRCQLCRSDSDCGAGESCASGRCEATPGYCASNDQCASGEECRGNRCVRVATTQSEVPGPTPPPPPPPALACDINAVYFDFESNELTSSARDQLQTVARCASERNYSRIHLTGNCDPRGTEEYNLALGDRRARAARDFLRSLGVAANKLSVSSNGEEYARGEDEGSWSRDRNVSIEAR